MKLNYDVLGNHIELVDCRNKDNITDRVLGINIDKFFMPSVANIIGTDLSRYKLISKGLFACNPMHVGRDERLPVALYDEDIPALISPAYFMFKVIDINKLNPEYLMLWFRRNEFDRHCWIKTDGSVRGGISWEDMCRIKVYVPSIEKQKSIVKAYNIISGRIKLKQKINDNLEAQVQLLFNDFFFSGESNDIILSDIAEINPNRILSKNQMAKCFDMSTLPIRGCIPVGSEIKPYNGGMKFQNGDTVLARITPCLENGKAAYINILNVDEIAFGSTEYIVLSPKNNIPSSFFYFLVRNKQFIAFAIKHMNGSSGRQRVSGSAIAMFPLKMPVQEHLYKFDKLASIVLEKMKTAANEIEKLKSICEVITLQISNF